jgi:GAF domain-containing protein
MLHNLGKLLVLCYFPDEYEEIKKEMLEKEIAEDNAVHSVLGISYNELGMAVSRSWNFPETIVRSMEVPPPGVIDPPRTEYDILRNLTNYANDLCDIVGNIEDENWGRAASRMANRYQKCIPLPVQQMDDLLASAANKIDQFSEIVRIDPTSSAFIKKLSSHIKPEKEEPPEAISETVESGKGLFLETLKASPKSPDAVAKAQAYIFASGVNEIADAMKSSYSLSDVMYMILETMYRACEFNRVIFCLRDVKEAKMVARFGLGEGAEKIVPFFQIDMGQTSDVFNIAINKGRGVVIEDADAPTIARSLPAWYRTHIGAPAFLVYPLVVKGNCIGLFYADKDVRGSLLTESQQKSMDDLNRMAIEVITQKHG